MVCSQVWQLILLSAGNAKGDVHWNIYTWPLHVAWASHSIVAGSQEGGIWRAGVHRELGRSYKVSSNKALEVTKHHFCHILLLPNKASPDSGW